MLTRVSSTELTEWQAFYGIEQARREAAAREAEDDDS
jgi:hypothetical protein